jgi:hypothetical protein
VIVDAVVLRRRRNTVALLHEHGLQVAESGRGDGEGKRIALRVAGHHERVRRRHCHRYGCVGDSDCGTDRDHNAGNDQE